ncbi:MAG: N-acetyltransferase family protein [Terracidiphilus sp.]
MQIRDAVESDIDGITAIYNEVLTHSTAIYNDRLATREDRLA